MKDFNEELIKLYSMIKSKKNFSFSKYADGEWSVIKNIPLNNNEFEFLPHMHQFYRNKLIESFKFKDDNYIIGISCECCQGIDTHKDMINFSEQKIENVTYANIFVNSNYEKYKELFIPIYKEKKVILVANTNSVFENLPFTPFKIYKVIKNSWVNNYSLISIIQNDIVKEDLKDCLFLFCCGPFGNILAHQLFEFNKNNTYIDIGSTLNPWLQSEGFKRSYYLPNSDVANRKCIWN